MEEQKEVRIEYRQQKERFIYYIIALAGTSIGFSVYKTTGLPLKASQLPLGFAVLMWALSIYCGLTGIQRSMQVLWANNAFFDVIQGRHPLAGAHPEKVQIGVDTLKKVMDEGNSKASRNFNWQLRFFYIGVLSFILWHVFEMYLLADAADHGC